MSRTDCFSASVANRFARRKLLRISSALLAIALFGSAVVLAQNFNRRDINGIVVDSQDKTVSGATVFLKDLKTGNIRSFTSTDNGSFRFAQIGMIDDYQVWAQKNKLKSRIKGISAFDSRAELHFELKLK